MWLVGEDVSPGVYRTVGPLVFDEEYLACDWAVFDGATQARASRLDDGYVRGGRPTVVLDAGQTFASSDCGDWSAVDPADFFQRSDASLPATSPILVIACHRI